MRISHLDGGGKYMKEYENYKEAQIDSTNQMSHVELPNGRVIDSITIETIIIDDENEN